MRFINAGFGNLLAAERIVSAASPDSAPIRRLVQEAKENGAAVDLACGRRCPLGDRMRQRTRGAFGADGGDACGKAR